MYVVISKGLIKFTVNECTVSHGDLLFHRIKEPLMPEEFKSTGPSFEGR